jgi:hypothetical protein
MLIKGLCSHLQRMREVTRIFDEVKKMEENTGKVSN